MEQAFDFSFRLRFLAKKGVNAELVGIPLIIGLSTLA
jgi:hypothetical protein